MDEARGRQGLLELHPELVDVDVDRAVAVAQRAAPDPLVQVLPPHDAPAAARERDQQSELAHRQAQRMARGQREPLARMDLEVTDLDRVLVLLCRRHGPPASTPRRGHP